MQPHTVDLAVLTRDERPLRAEVSEALRSQRGVKLNVHRIVGTPQKEDPSRLATITRARNAAVRRARSPWLMFLDDEVVLAPDCVARLHHALASRPDFGAMAADYLGESNPHGPSEHVAMGATLFRRSVFDRISFRWAPKRCECLCCCEDLRGIGARVDYLEGARAWHLQRSHTQCDAFAPPQLVRNAASAQVATNDAIEPGDSNPGLSQRAKVLVAFNRRDVGRFRTAFLPSLRRAGNRQEVIVVGYGLYPSESRLLSQLPSVRVISKPVNGVMPPIRRLHDFGEIIGSFDPDTPVAYWDASDVLFQGSLDPLWQLTQSHPEKLLAVREPLGYPYNRAIVGWTRTIRDPAMARRAFELFSSRPFLNSGFAAGTAQTMKNYFTEAMRLRQSPDLIGTTDWGDQTALNLYCHHDADRWHEIPESWNFCVHDRAVGDVHVTPQGRVVSGSQPEICVVHGNARSLPKLLLRS